jgi:hypothetical protein
VIFLLNACVSDQTTTANDESTTPIQLPHNSGSQPAITLTDHYDAEQSVLVNQGVLKHLHRNTISGVLTPVRNYIDSPNAKV